jgi:hypothetical protein
MMTRNRKQLILDYKEAFGTAGGKRVLNDLKLKCQNLYRSSREVNPGLDPNLMMYQEGQRSVMLYIFKTLNADPNAERPDRAINKEAPK